LTNQYVYAYRDDLNAIITSFDKGTFTRIELEEKCGIGMSKIKKMAARDLIVSKGSKVIRGYGEKKSHNLTIWTIPYNIIRRVKRYN
jgi:hypothetical protein